VPWLLLRRVAAAVRNRYQFAGDTVKRKNGRGACGLFTTGTRVSGGSDLVRGELN
jgi:hypothetical protein